ncbi:MAG: response regulator, partial [Burkholderiales bacterium]|nr:response regulator [Burkholderiales bacterium]
MRILLVEDDELLGSGLCDALQRAHYPHEWVREGRAALAAALTTDFDLIVLDLGLPGLDGMTVLQELRARGAAVPVLILSARDAARDRVRGLNAGADDYLVKPFDLEE